MNLICFANSCYKRKLSTFSWGFIVIYDYYKGTLFINVGTFEKILLSESEACRSSNLWGDFWGQTGLLVNVSRANFDYVFVDLFNAKVDFLKKMK